MISSKKIYRYCRELDLDINMSSILSDLKEEIREGVSRLCRKPYEYLNAIILSYYLDFEFIDVATSIVFDKKVDLIQKLHKQR